MLFEDGTDLYWARSRVLEYLSQAVSRLPTGLRPAIGPDATGVGWIYEYALTDRSGRHDLSQLRGLQDWFLKLELQSVPGVAEVASVGGMVRQYQVVVDPIRLRGFGLTLADVKSAIERGNQEAGGAVIELAEAEYMVRSSGYIRNLDDLRAIPLRASGTVPVTLAQVAELRIGPEMRRGIAELDGEGEVAGGIVVMRSGENARETIRRVRERLAELRGSLPEGVEIVETYDRSSLIDRAVDNLRGKLAEELLVVVLVCAVFLFHFRSSLIVVISLPIGILAAFVVMQLQGINANIMSLGGIAIAIGAMIDAGIVMIENVHRKLEAAGAGAIDRLKLVSDACGEVGPALFFSLMIVALSFMPVFALGAQEGRLFVPLAFTKTYAMLAAAVLSVTLIPVLILLLVRGRIHPESANPLNRAAMAAYRPMLEAALRHPRAVLAMTIVLIAATALPASRLGREFMPDMFEGDLMYMPTALPDISADTVRALLQQTDRMIRTVPEVEHVFGKAGRADTATDPAPFEMLETTVRLKPRDQWRPGLTVEGLRAELDRAVQVPGIANVWVPPIKTRIDMLATGIKTPVGIKVTGPDLAVIERIGAELEAALRGVQGVASVYAERAATGRYLDVEIRRGDAARYGLNIADIQETISYAIGGMNVGNTVEGLERYPINLRYPQDWRDSPERLRTLPLIAADGAQLMLGDVATIRITDGPAMIRSENARPSGWVYVDIRDRDLGSFVDDAKEAVSARVSLPAGYRLQWSGQYEYWQRALEKLKLIIPATFAVIVLLLYLNFRRFGDVALILGSLPFALIGGVWFVFLLGFHVSIAVIVGFIALAGVAAETGVVMLLYLNQAWARRVADAANSGRALAEADVRASITEGALLRLRPKLMTVLTIMIGLLPIMWGSGAGSEVMRRIAAPMIGGMVTATFLTLLVIPALFLLWKRRDIA